MDARLPAAGGKRAERVRGCRQKGGVQERKDGKVLAHPSLPPSRGCEGWHVAGVLAAEAARGHVVCVVGPLIASSRAISRAS